MTTTFDATLWLYPGEGAWVFVTLPSYLADDIKLVSRNNKHGFGSVRVTVHVNDVQWNTSIFPDSKSGSYLLPIKRSIREQANISTGDTANFKIELRDLD